MLDIDVEGQRHGHWRCYRRVHKSTPWTHKFSLTNARTSLHFRLHLPLDNLALNPANFCFSEPEQVHDQVISRLWSAQSRVVNAYEVEVRKVGLENVVPALWLYYIT